MYKERTEQDKQSKENKQKVEELTALINRYGNKDHVENLRNGIIDAHRVLKQLSITVGFFLSFYKEIQDHEDAMFLKSVDGSNSALSETLQKFNL